MLFLIFGICFAAETNQPMIPQDIESEIKPMLLKDATPVLLRTTEKMISGATPVNSIVEYRVIREVVSSDGKILIPYGAKAFGKVIQSEKRGMLGKAGKFSFSVNKVISIDGTEAPLRSSLTSSGKSNTTAVVVGTLFLSVLMVFVHGRDVVIPENTIITAYIDGDFFINKPLPIPNDRTESIKIEVPKPGTEFVKGSIAQIAVNVYPFNSIKTVKIFVNENLLIEHTGQPEIINWETKDLKLGEYQIDSEVTFEDGHSIKADPVKVAIIK